MGTDKKKTSSVKKAVAAAVNRAVARGSRSRSRSASAVRFASKSRSRSRSKPRAASSKKKKTSKTYKESHKGTTLRTSFLPPGKKFHVISRKINTNGSTTMTAIYDAGQFRTSSGTGNDTAGCISWLFTITPNIANTEIGNEARNWEKFYFHGAEVTFCNTLGSTQSGAITGFFDTDPLANYTIGGSSDFNLQQAITHTSHRTTAVNTTCTWKLSGKADKKIVYYVRNNPGSNTQARVTFPAKFVVTNMVDLASTATVYGVFLVKFTLTFFERSLQNSTGISESSAINWDTTIIPDLTVPVTDGYLQKKLVTVDHPVSKKKKDPEPDTVLQNTLFPSIIGGLKAMIYAALGGATAGLSKPISSGESTAGLSNIFVSSNNCSMMLAPGQYEIDLDIYVKSAAGKFIYFDGSLHQLIPGTGGAPTSNVVPIYATILASTSSSSDVSYFGTGGHSYAITGRVQQANGQSLAQPLSTCLTGNGYFPYPMGVDASGPALSYGSGTCNQTSPAGPGTYTNCNCVMSTAGVLRWKCFVNMRETASVWSAGQGTGSNTEFLIGGSPNAYATSNNALNGGGTFDLQVSLNWANSDTVINWTMVDGNIGTGNFTIAGGSSISVFGSKWNIRQIDNSGLTIQPSQNVTSGDPSPGVMMIQFQTLENALRSGYDENYVYPNSGPPLTPEQSKKLLADRTDRLNPITTDEEKLLATINKLFGRASELPSSSSSSSPPLKSTGKGVKMVSQAIKWPDPSSLPADPRGPDYLLNLDPNGPNPISQVRAILRKRGYVSTTRTALSEGVYTLNLYAVELDGGELHWLTTASGSDKIETLTQLHCSVLRFWSAQNQEIPNLMLWPLLGVGRDGLVTVSSRSNSKKKKPVTLVMKETIVDGSDSLDDSAE